jgi:Cft2 family RNA processing exonuclease
MKRTATATLRFVGAAQAVTGCKHWIRTGGRQILLDAGLFQGLKALRLRSRAPPPFEPAGLDAVLLSHAHIDHSGYLPVLVRQGFPRSRFTARPERQICSTCSCPTPRICRKQTQSARTGVATRSIGRRCHSTSARMPALCSRSNDGASSVRIDGADIPVRARVEILHGFSAHGDRDEIFRWLLAFEVSPRHTYVVHGEPRAADALAGAIRVRLGWPMSAPLDGMEVEL